jgi:hypothetical protein
MEGKEGIMKESNKKITKKEWNPSKMYRREGCQTSEKKKEETSTQTVIT